MEEKEAIVLRLDKGHYRSRGLFQCTVPGCDWKSEASLDAAYKHLSRGHSGMRGTVKSMKEPLSEEEKREKNRIACKLSRLNRTRKEGGFLCS